MACIGGLEALARSHEARDAVHGTGTGERRGQPGVQRKRVSHWPYVGRHGRSVEGQHRRVMELHATHVHFFLSPPFCTSILEPNLYNRIKSRTV